ncbi:MAG: conjugal transfer protein TraF [Simkania negevensis]|nr:conjugal transfer protein TraF [Simkania negevensis]
MNLAKRFCPFPLFLFVLVLTLKNSLFANSTSWYDQKLEGWYYFEDFSNQPNREKKEQITSPEEAAEKIELEKQKLQKLLSLALLQPTEQNVENYMQAQQKWINQSAYFSLIWQKALLKNPLLGDFLENPTTTYGVLARKERDLKERQALLQNLSKEHFLLFFFQGKDFFSQKAAEAIKLFSSLNGFKVQAVSLDGEGIIEFPRFEKDHGISAQIGVKATPSLFVINPFTNQIAPVGAGLLSVQQIEENIESQFAEHHKDRHD